jgi:hypothetical protein
MNWFFAAAATICFAAHNKVRRVVDVCLLTCNHKIYAYIIARINMLFVVAFVVVCRECIMR